MGVVLQKLGNWRERVYFVILSNGCGPLGQAGDRLPYCSRLTLLEKVCSISTKSNECITKSKQKLLVGRMNDHFWVYPSLPGPMSVEQIKAKVASVENDHDILEPSTGCSMNTDDDAAAWISIS